jgi:hypothetical protein
MSLATFWLLFCLTLLAGVIIGVAVALDRLK